jgi:hypothetical protein
MVERLGWRGHQVPLVQKAKNLQALGTCRFYSERLLGSAPSGGMYRFLLHDFDFTVLLHQDRPRSGHGLIL